jgi:hypothetical protein
MTTRASFATGDHCLLALATPREESGHLGAVEQTTRAGSEGRLPCLCRLRGWAGTALTDREGR